MNTINKMLMIFFLLLIGLTNVNALGTWYNLSGTDVDGWVENYYSPQPRVLNGLIESENNIYTIGTNSLFGVYNPSTNEWYNLSSYVMSGIGNFIGQYYNINAIEKDNNGNIYLSSSYATFGYYNPDDNTPHEITNGWTQEYVISSMVHDTNTDFIYTASTLLGYYNPSTDTWYNLNSPCGSYLLEINSVQDRIFIGSDETICIYYPQNDSYEILYDLIPLLNGIVSMESHKDLLYIGGSDGRFGVYNYTSNTYTDLSDTDEDAWMWDIIKDLEYDENLDILYISAFDSGMGIYNPRDNITRRNISDTDVGNWMNFYYEGMGGDLNVIAKLLLDSNNKLYTGGNFGILGVYELDCYPDWLQVLSECTNNEQTISYTDLNNCNYEEYIPLDNGNTISCNNEITGDLIKNVDASPIIKALMTLFVVGILIGMIFMFYNDDAIENSTLKYALYIFGVVAIILLIYFLIASL